MKAIADRQKRNYGWASISLLVGLDHLDYLDWPGWVLQFDVGDPVRLSVSIVQNRWWFRPVCVRYGFRPFYNDLRECDDRFRPRGIPAADARIDCFAS
jgi:hypothetical protein